MTVAVERHDHPRYGWVVKIGPGSGGRIVSRHELKRRAKQKGKRLARKRGDTLTEEMQAGYTRTVADYG